MDWQDLGYATTQIVHNFGAVAVVGGSFCALASHDERTIRCLAWIVLAGWATQAASGATFGAISFYNYGRFPDISGIASVALGIKMTCAALGFFVAAWQLLGHPSAASGRRGWLALCILGALALGSAAVLRWFS